MNNEKWSKVKFEDICKIISDRIDDPKESDDDYYVGLEHLDSEEPKILRSGSPQDVSKTKLKFKNGDILFGRRNWYLRRVAVAEKDGICSAHMMVLRPKSEKILNEFLPLLMFGNDFFNKALSISAGSMSPTIKWKDLAQLEFHIPPISVQKNIISIISIIDNSIIATRNLLESLNVYMTFKINELMTQGIGHKKFKKVKWLFGKEIEIPEEWKELKLSDISEKITDGEHLTPMRQDTGVMLLSARNIKNRFIDLTEDIDYISIKEYDRIKKHCNPEFGDILISCSGTIGRVTSIKIKESFGLVRSVALIKLKKDIVDSIFLENFLLSRIAQLDMVTNQHQSSQPNLFQSQIRNLHVFLPNITEQQKIVLILTEINESINKISTHLSKLKIMKKSILSEKLIPRKLEVKELVQ